jgi:O-antigen/teichoic acid export membrane protein
MKITPLAINFGLSAATSAALLMVVGVTSGTVAVGKLGLWMGYAVILSQIISLGMQNGIYEVCRENVSRVYTYSALAVMLSCGIASVIWLPLELINKWVYDFHSLNIHLLMAYSLSISLHKVFRSSFTILNSFDVFHYISIFKSILIACLSIGLYFAVVNVGLLFICLTVIEIVLAVIMSAFLFTKKGIYLELNLLKAQSLIKKSYMGFVSNSIYEINSKVDIVICSIILSPTYLGVYVTVSTVFDGFIALCTLRKSETFDVFLRATEDKNLELIDSKIRAELFFLMKWLVPCFVGGVVYITITVGDTAVQTFVMLFFMLLSANVLGSVLGLQNVYYSFGKQKLFAGIMLSALLLNILSSIILGHFFGMLGVGISTALATCYVSVGIKRFTGALNA